MTRTFVVLCSFAALVSCGERSQTASPQPADEEALAAEARELVKTFGGEMQAALQSAISEGGPLEAPAVCREKAPAIAARLSSESGWEIGRTSQKIRNPANQPDDWESSILTLFHEQAAEGDDPGEMEFFLIEDDQFRYMKPITIQSGCLLCHGKALSAGVAAKLDELYPADAARDYHLGEIRGAFTLTKSLAE